MSTTTWADAAKALEKLCGAVTKRDKYIHSFSVVSIGKTASSGSVVPTVESKLYMRQTGLDLTDRRTLAAIIVASQGRLFSDGIKVWDSVAEAERKAKRAASRNTAKHLRSRK